MDAQWIAAVHSFVDPAMDATQCEWLRDMFLAMDDVDDLLDLTQQLSEDGREITRDATLALLAASTSVDGAPADAGAAAAVGVPPSAPRPPPSSLDSLHGSAAASVGATAPSPPPTAGRTRTAGAGGAAELLRRRLRNEFEWMLRALPSAPAVSRAVAELDPSIVEYVRAVCRAADADDADSVRDVLGVLRDIIPPAFGSGDGEEDIARRMVEAAGGGASAGSDGTAAPHKAPRGGGSRRLRPAPPIDAEEPAPAEPKAAGATAAGVAVLRELHPSVPEKVLRRILVERAWGDVDKAALLTMEEPALLGEVAAQLEREASAARLDAEQEAAARRAINKRYGNIVARERGDVAPACRPRAARDVTSVNSAGKSRTKRGGRSKIRYRDNQIVTRTGDRAAQPTVVVDEYDGGSRGRVKTKGKRGKGFV